MGFDWTPIENSFPAFREDESPAEMAKKIHDYLYRLINQLKYTLQNLDTENWNAAALAVFSESTTKGVTEQAGRLAAQLIQLSGSLSNLSGRLTETGNRITQNENEISYLQNGARETETRLADVEQFASQNRVDIDSIIEEMENIAILTEELASLAENIEMLLRVVHCGEESTVMGEEGKPLYLWGDVYINGVLYNGGESE